MTLNIGKGGVQKVAYKPWKLYEANTTNGDMVLDKNFREFLELLNSNEVRYLVVGGYAVAFHGHPRYTRDIDLWIDRVPENAKNLMFALAEFGFGSVDLKAEDFLTEDQIVQLGQPPNRIDLLTSISGVEFSECFESKVVGVIDKIPINFIGLELLVKNKKASGRLQDLADVEKLEG